MTLLQVVTNAGAGGVIDTSVVLESGSVSNFAQALAVLPTTQFGTTLVQEFLASDGGPVRRRNLQAASGPQNIQDLVNLAKSLAGDSQSMVCGYSCLCTSTNHRFTCTTCIVGPPCPEECPYAISGVPVCNTCCMPPSGAQRQCPAFPGDFNGCGPGTSGEVVACMLCLHACKSALHILKDGCMAMLIALLLHY